MLLLTRLLICLLTYCRLVLDEADRLLDMGFEKDIVEALGIIRGCALPGYGNISSDVMKPSKITLHQKYSQQLASMAKTCTELSNLVHIMASATLTNSVKSLAIPMMGYSLTTLFTILLLYSLIYSLRG